MLLHTIISVTLRNGWLRLSRETLSGGGRLPPQYQRYARIWFWLGLPAFTAMLGIVLLMVFKPTF